MWFLTADPVVCILMVLTEFSPRKTLREFLEEAKLWRLCPIVWHIPSLLYLFAPRRWPSSPSSDYLMSSRSPNSAVLRSFSLTICILAPESDALLLRHLGEPTFLQARKMMIVSRFTMLTEDFVFIKSPNFLHEVPLCQYVFCTGLLWFWSSGRSRNFGLSGSEYKHCV